MSESPAQPLGQRLAAGESIPLEEATAVGAPACDRCGLPMPAMSADALEAYQAAVRAGVPVVLTHEVCPGTEAAPPSGRYFEARVSIVEVVEIRDDDFDTPSVAATELLSFVVSERADNLVKAMRPLARSLGEKWQDGEKRAHIADAPAGTAEVGS